MNNEPYAHVYARIAEHVSRALDPTIDAEDVRAVLQNDRPRDLHEDTVTLIFEEADEYGLPA